MQAVTRPSKLKCTEVFGMNMGSMVHSSLLSAEFRNAETLLEQINIIKKITISATVIQLCTLFNISTRRYYKVLKNIPIPAAPNLPRPPTQQLLLNEEEYFNIQQIFQHQLDNDCLTTRDVRDIASGIFKERTGDERSFSRDWVKRHSDEIDKIKTCSVDDDRANIDLDEVNTYIETIEEVLSHDPNPLLFLNMDESGFGRRPEKGKRKSVLISKKCEIQPFWRESSDAYHISLVLCVSAACSYLRPLLISTRKTMDSEISDTFFNQCFDYTMTKKGYQTSCSMLIWVKTIFKPYVELMRSLTDGNETCYLILDGCTAHFSEEIQKEIDSIGDVVIIPIPAYSSHLSQILDATIFGSLKRRYSSIPSDSTIQAKFTRKLMRIKAAFQSSVTEELILSGWEQTGFNLSISNGEVTQITFDENFKRMILAEAGETFENDKS